MTRMEILGGAEVGVMVGLLVMVGVKDGGNVWSSVGDGVMVTGIFNTRVTSDVSTRVTSLVTSTFCITGTDMGLATNGAQATAVTTSRNAAKQDTSNFKRFFPFRKNRSWAIHDKKLDTAIAPIIASQCQCW